MRSFVLPSLVPSCMPRCDDICKQESEDETLVTLEAVAEVRLIINNERVLTVISYYSGCESTFSDRTLTAALVSTAKDAFTGPNLVGKALMLD